MTATIRKETITPAIAHSYLAKSGGNRRLNTDYVLSLAVAMESGKWDPDASELVFDLDDVLIDGHHRLNAVLSYDQPVDMLVKRGVSKLAKNVIDTGRTRSINDLMGMFRVNVDYVNQRRAALNTCVGLMMVGKSRPPSIRTLDAYDSWMRQFKDGIDAMIVLLAGGNRSRVQALRKGPVLGAFAFAHKTNPRKVEAFTERVRDGVMLGAKEPANTMRNMLLSPTMSGRNTGGDRTYLSKKVLSGLYAELKGQSWGKAQAGEEGLLYFRKAYDQPAIEKLVDLWSVPAEAVAEEVG